MKSSLIACLLSLDFDKGIVGWKKFGESGATIGIVNPEHRAGRQAE
jgi:hypothetical protein